MRYLYCCRQACVVGLRWRELARKGRCVLAQMLLFLRSLLPWCRRFQCLATSRPGGAGVMVGRRSRAVRSSPLSACVPARKTVGINRAGLDHPRDPRAAERVLHRSDGGGVPVGLDLVGNGMLCRLANCPSSGLPNNRPRNYERDCGVAAGIAGVGWVRLATSPSRTRRT